jgi:hypothetical protein
MVTEKRSGGASFARGVGFGGAAYDEKSFVAVASASSLILRVGTPGSCDSVDSPRVAATREQT